MTLQVLLEGIAEESRREPELTRILENVSRLWPNYYRAMQGRSGEHGLTNDSALCAFDATMLAAASSDRPWIGGALAIQGAVRYLLDGVSHPLEHNADECVAFCASEIGGNRPSSIETALSRRGTVWSLSGSKRYATLGPLASHLIVIASEGRDDSRNHLRAVVIPTERAGVAVEEMTIPGALPSTLRLPHGLLHFDGVEVEPAEVLEGDGYSRYLKPYRTIEDAFSVGAHAASLLSVGLRSGAAVDQIDGLVSLLQSVRSAAAEGLATPASHLVVNAAERQLAALAKQIAPRFSDEVQSWWTPDEAIPVAPTAKAMRAERALADLRGEHRE